MAINEVTMLVALGGDGMALGGDGMAIGGVAVVLVVSRRCCSHDIPS